MVNNNSLLICHPHVSLLAIALDGILHSWLPATYKTCSILTISDL